MIKLTNIDTPQILVDNQEKWTKQYLDLLHSSKDVPSSLKHKYREQSIKEQIVKETHNNAFTPAQDRATLESDPSKA